MGSDLIQYLKTDEPHWWIDRMYLQDAIRAARPSTDPNTQVGCVLVSPVGAGVVIRSCNSVPDRLLNAGYPLCSEHKNYCTEHAERRVIFSAIKRSLRVEGMTMYCTWASCAECSRAIIEFGVNRVVTFSALVESTPDRWAESIEQGLRMMRDSGILVVGWRGDIGMPCSLRFNGKTVTERDLK